MKKKILRVISLVVLCAFVVTVFTACGKKEEKFISPTEKFFVNDFASVLTEADANTIYTSGVALQEATTAQAIVVTVDSLDGKAIEDYALEIGREWGVGAEDKDNGIVVLLSEGDREIYIAVGYGLEGALPDSKTGRIIDTYGISYFSSDNFSAGLLGIYNAIVNEIYIEYGMQPSENYVPIDLLPQISESQTSAGEIALSWLALIIIVVVYVAVFSRRGGLFIFSSPRFFGGHYHGSGGFGGSSGGFGGFSGGGGSFGGGGAGRKF